MISSFLLLIKNNGLLLFLADPPTADLLSPTGYGFQYHRYFLHLLPMNMLYTYLTQWLQSVLLCILLNQARAGRRAPGFL